MNRMILVVAVFLLMSGAVFAQEADALTYGIAESFVEFHGMVAQEFFDYQEDGDNGGVGTFNTAYAYINVMCTISEQLSGVIEIELPNGGQDMEVDRAYADYKVHDLLGLKIGKFYQPFLYDVSMYRPTGDMFVTSRFWGLTAPDLFRDTGVEAYGSTEMWGMKWGYNLAVGNGHGPSHLIMNQITGETEYGESATDTNEFKSVVARLNWTPIEGLDLSLSYTGNEFDVIMTTIMMNPAPPNQIWTIDTSMGVWSTAWLAATAVFEKGPFKADGYLFDGFVDAELTTKVDMKIMHGQVSYDLLHGTDQSLDVGFKFETVKFDIGALTGFPGQPDEWQIYAIGAAYRPQKNFVVKFEWRWEKENEGAEIDNNGVLLSAVLDF